MRTVRWPLHVTAGGAGKAVRFGGIARTGTAIKLISDSIAGQIFVQGDRSA
jgi:hypothetical protein